MKFKDLDKRIKTKNREDWSSNLNRDLSLELAHLIVSMRIRTGLTQGELAKLVGTKQPGIARAERGVVLPSIGLLARIATKLGKKLLIEVVEIDKKQPVRIVHPTSVHTDTPVISPYLTEFHSSKTTSNNDAPLIPYVI